MLPENALLESRAMRDSFAGRTHVLDKVKALVMLPDGLHVTTRMVADYFEVDLKTLQKLLERHRNELDESGFHIMRGAELREYETDSMSVSSESYPQRRNSLALWPRRAILNVAMLLRDSAVARRVRTYLLDVEEASRRATRPEPEPEPWEREYEPGGTDIGDALHHIGTVLHGMSTRLDSVDRKVTQTQHVVNAINVELCATRQDVLRLDARMELLEDAWPTPLPGVQRPHLPPARRRKRRQ
ncbi:hypothetical protein AB0M28_01015 [Streptomyces sp. NPDC051940]|uniref:hypothetical protein n=1 Tax=Streptomyces sp. NPDC051940 TaxID=3155675 RepID=UPI0034237F24